MLGPENAHRRRAREPSARGGRDAGVRAAGEPDHHRYIDALRGVAFLGVLTVHVGQQAYTTALGRIPFAGRYGVQLFFLLSAVTLLRSLSLRASTDGSPVRDFYLRRFFRVAPLFWFGIVFYTLLDGCGPRSSAPEGIGAWSLASTWFFLHGWTPLTINSVVPGGWSIAVEMTFYLCLPWLAGQLTTAGRALLAAFGLAGCAALLNWMIEPFLAASLPAVEHRLVPAFLFYWFPWQLPVFLVGVAVYHGLHDPASKQFLAAPGRAAALGAVGTLGLAVLAPLKDSDLVPWHVLVTAAFGLIVLALAARPFAWVVNGWTCRLGTLSFSAYLMHFTAVRLAASWLSPGHFTFLAPPFAGLLRFAAVWASALGLTVALSSLTYLLIEKPGIRLGNRLLFAGEPPASRLAAVRWALR